MNLEITNNISLSSLNIIIFHNYILGSSPNRSFTAEYVLPWIGCILVNHNDYILSQEPETQLLDSLYKVVTTKSLFLEFCDLFFFIGVGYLIFIYLFIFWVEC